MAEVKFFKVNELPVTPDKNAWYLLSNGNYAEAYVSDNLGVLKMVGNSLMINQIITSSSNNSIAITSYVHTQGVATLIWTINHNLNYYPNVSIVDSSGSVVIGDIVYINTNTIIASFSGAFSGLAYLS